MTQKKGEKKEERMGGKGRMEGEKGRKKKRKRKLAPDVKVTQVARCG